jgi:hypothetical protein
VSDTEATEGVTPEVPEPEMGTQQDQGEMPAPQAETAADDDTQALSDALKAARADAIKYRTRLREMEAEQQAKRDAEMTDSERQAKELADLRQELAQRDEQTRRLALESAVALRSNAMGIVDAEAAVKLIDTASLDFDDYGRPDSESLDQALKRLIKSKPYLKTQPPAASPANPARTEPAGETDAQRRARLFGGGGGIFDVDTARSLGGGVLNSDS